MVPAWITAMLVKVISITGPAAYVHCISIIPCHLLPLVTGYLHRMTQRIGSIGDGYMQCIWLPWVGPIRMHLLSRSRLLQQYHEGMCRHLHLLDSWWLQSLRCLTDNGQQALSQSGLQFCMTLSHCSCKTYMVCLMLLLCALVCCCSACYAHHLQME